MKKIISLCLCLMMIFSAMSISVSANSVDSSRDDLNALFLDGEKRGTDYVYYSPVKENDSTKYPVMVWLHGNTSGTEKREQLKWYGFSNWASDEYQARFENAGGCFLIAPRANSVGNTWSLVTTGELKKVIDAFLSDFSANVDYSRIYVAGYSVGGDMTWRMLTDYPEFFAAGIPCAAITPPTALGVSALTDTSVWMINCDIDNYLSARTSNIKPVYNELCNITNRKDGIRLTSFSEVVMAQDYKHPSSTPEHMVWESVTYDMHMADKVTPYKYTTTVDGNGSTITFENAEYGVIKWLSLQTNERADDGSKSESGFMAMIRKIIDFFKNLFSSIFG